MKSFASIGLSALSASQAVLAHYEALTPEKLAADIKTEELERNLYNLQYISDRNGGNRAFGLPGYKASMDYVLERAQERFGDQYDTWVQPFNHTFSQVNEMVLTGPDGEAVDTVSLIYNPGTPLPDGYTALLVDTPVDDERGSACFEDQWEGIDATGKIALVKRGACAISDKLKLAKAHGALAVVMYHNEEGTPGSATLGAENIGQIVPIATIWQDVGEAWSARLSEGEELEITLVIDAIFEERETWNIFAETKVGSPDNVIMLGAHLDSVQAGAGINDDGSGTSGILEILTALRNYDSFGNKVRFAWWGAEESGLVGSLLYTAGLTAEEADSIRFYFNYDMIGSPYPVYAVYAGENSGDYVGAQPLLDYLMDVGGRDDAYFGGFGSSSDYYGFLQLGIAASGLFTGAGAPMDPCYHLECDQLDNVDLEALTLNTKAAAHALAQLALMDPADLPKRSNGTSVNRRAMVGGHASAREMRAQFARWERAASHAEAGKSCAHAGDGTI